jgi:hypothetical protein
MFQPTWWFCASSRSWKSRCSSRISVLSCDFSENVARTVVGRTSGSCSHCQLNVSRSGSCTSVYSPLTTIVPIATCHLPPVSTRSSAITEVLGFGQNHSASTDGSRHAYTTQSRGA